MRSKVDASVVSWLHGSTLCVALLALVACQQTDSSLPSSPQTLAPAGQGSAPIRLQARLAPPSGGPGQGVLLLEISEDELNAKVRATGLEPLAVIPQHIHVNPTCAPGGGVLINLDAGLTVAGEGLPTGSEFPTANLGGVLQYDASRSLADLIDAVNEHQSAGVSTVEELLDWLNLEERNMHTHQPVAPFTPVACGPIDRIGEGGAD